MGLTVVGACVSATVVCPDAAVEFPIAVVLEESVTMTVIPIVVAGTGVTAVVAFVAF